MSNHHRDLYDTLLQKDLLSQVGAVLNGFIHNVCGPLQNMILLVENLNKRQKHMNDLVSAGNGFDHTQVVESSDAQLHRLQQLSEQLLALTKITEDIRVLQRLLNYPSWIDLRPAIETLVALCRCDRFAKYQVTFELNLPQNLPVIGIPGNKLTFALMRFLMNALYAVRDAEEKRIAIECRAHDDWIRLSVRDSGREAAADPMDKDFFSLFELADSQTRSRAEDTSRYGRPGLWTVSRVLAPYGARVQFESDRETTATILMIPIRGREVRPLK
ncbi:ATP-binding protein [Desulfoferrobacter suflitae]|uniref:ATP-binding protein n=1 Tax=Desulfoferrobacter suflitae TaxID=2865782 RepID=UPI0021645222|nr:ATP-binding protein [Desulfoferrobacter suflitae]MCK8602393.1 hypothetical protein [Desulfoferrobacter suflitae]